MNLGVSSKEVPDDGAAGNVLEKYTVHNFLNFEPPMVFCQFKGVTWHERRYEVRAEDANNPQFARLCIQRYSDTGTTSKVAMQACKIVASTCAPTWHASRLFQHVCSKLFAVKYKPNAAKRVVQHPPRASTLSLDI